MTEQPDGNQGRPPIYAGQTEDGRTVVVTPNGMAVEGPQQDAGRGEDVVDSEVVDDDGAEGDSVTDMVEQPAKVMRIGTMIRTLLEEVKSAPLDDPSRTRLRDIHAGAVTELKSGLSDELAAELERLAEPFTGDAVPSDAELRIAQAQLVGWLEGLFQGIQTALFAQQMAARAQLEQMRRALPGAEAAARQQPPQRGSGMYL
ncbi:bacterial proteasome activator family protein [Desertihabitans brevis]|uniref:Bacterial proteasome activator n=1 Tax=Desertihabitans brevis TaxID=2268447 RepID=A0A367YRI6_9ACTN|nr:bacterial proteasome activator family protein [Desertihabitans brevis]RCK68438.1 bacterial proteasome activator family protein [Desertihabitans brevis]